jgi:hypothetical protein
MTRGYGNTRLRAEENHRGRDIFGITQINVENRDGAAK